MSAPLLLAVACWSDAGSSSDEQRALASMRHWLSQNRDVVGCRTDDNFLLRFLRARKLSIYQAQQMLLKYLNFRQSFSHLVFKLDPLDKAVMELLNSGYIFVSPFKDKFRRPVIIYNVGKVNSQKHTNADMSRAHMITYEALLEDEDAQINGVSHIVDAKNASPSIITMWSPSELARAVRWGEHSLPLSHKEIHVINYPTPFRYVYDFLLSRVSPKIQERVMLHNSPDNLLNKVDHYVLPKELGGKTTMQEMIDLWKAKVQSHREKLLNLDSMKLLNAEDIITSKNNSKNYLVGSFRQLEID